MNLTASLIIDFIMVGFLSIFIYRGAKQGLFITVFTMLAVFWALTCGWFLATHYSDGIMETIRPGIEGKINTYSGSSASAAESMGYSGAFSEAVENQAASPNNAISTLGGSIASVFARSIMFLLGFAAVMVIWLLLARCLTLATRFPVLHTVDRIMGGIMGLLLGYIFLLLLHWVLFDLLPFLPSNALDQCYLAPLLVSRPFFFLIGA